VTEFLALAVVVVWLPLIVLAPKARAVLLVAGMLFVFQSSDQLSASKLAVLALVALSASLGLTAPIPGPMKAVTRWSLIAGAILAVLCARAVILLDRDLIQVIRDAAAYALLLAAPLICRDLGRIPARWLERLTLIAGAIGAALFSFGWAVRRGLLSSSAVGFASPVMVTLAIAGFTAKAITSRSPSRWWALASGVAVAALASGTRNMLLNLLVPVVVVGWARLRSPASRGRLRRSVARLLLVAPFAIVATVMVLSLAGFNTAEAFNRVGTVFQLGQTGSSASLEEREIQQDQAYQLIENAPVLGNGPGYEFRTYRPTSNIYTESLSIDTSYAVFAKWGLLGAASLIGLLVTWWLYLRPRRKAITFTGLVTLGIVPVIVLQSALSATMEDKGLPLVLILLGATSVAERRESSSADDSEAVPQLA
jgi:hypothetical protein